MKYIDYYKVLGVERDAPQDQIAKAYKRLARKYHPDLNKANDAEAQFKQINEAYEALKDPEKRKRYDTLGASWQDGSPFEPPPGWATGPGGVRFDFGGGSGGGGFAGGGFSDFFEMIFGSGGGGARRGGGFNLDDILRGGGGGGGSPFGRRAQPARGDDVDSELTVQLEDVFFGRTKSIQLSGPGGSRRYDVTIPKGIKDGERIRLAGQGFSGQGSASGDLYLTIRVAPHSRFEVEGHDLVVELPVSAWDAALGTTLEVPTIDGAVQMKLPPGVSSGQRLRLRSKGIPRRGGSPGDLYARITVTVPSKLSDEQRRLFEELKQTEQ